MSEILQSFIVVFGLEELFAFDAKRPGDSQNLVRNPRIEMQQFVQFLWRQEIPVNDLSCSASDASIDEWILVSKLRSLLIILTEPRFGDPAYYRDSVRRKSQRDSVTYCAM